MKLSLWYIIILWFRQNGTFVQCKPTLGIMLVWKWWVMLLYLHWQLAISSSTEQLAKRGTGLKPSSCLRMTFFPMWKRSCFNTWSLLFCQANTWKLWSSTWEHGHLCWLHSMIAFNLYHALFPFPHRSTSCLYQDRIPLFDSLARTFSTSWQLCMWHVFPVSCGVLVLTEHNNNTVIRFLSISRSPPVFHYMPTLCLGQYYTVYQCRTRPYKFFGFTPSKTHYHDLSAMDSIACLKL